MTTMKKMPSVPLFLFACCFGAFSAWSELPSTEKSQVDAYWATVSRAVPEGDFAGYKATCHEDGVLVAGTQQKSYPLTEALAGWKKEFDDTREGKRTSNVEFRFSQRILNANTAHETGIFLYTAVDGEGKQIAEYVHLEALLVKKNQQWKILMEYQKSKATQAEWDALAPHE